MVLKALQKRYVELSDKKRMICIVAILAIPNLVCWIVAFPGFFQADHQSRIATFSQGCPSAWHSLLWQVLSFPLLYFSPSYGVYGLSQIALFAFFVCFSIQKLMANNFITKGQSLLLALVFGLFPTFLLYNLSYSSDIVFSYTLIPITTLLIVVISKRDCINKKDVIELFLFLLLAALLRKNALILLIVVSAALLFSLKEMRFLVGICLLGLVSSFLIINVSLTVALSASSSPSQEILSVPANQIGSVYASGGHIPQEAANTLEKIRTPEEWAALYNPYSADAEKTGLSATPEFLKAWILVVLENPITCFKAYIKMMAPFWELTASSGLAENGNNYIVDFANYDVFTLDYVDTGRYADQFVSAPTGSLYPGRRGDIALCLINLMESDIPMISDTMRLIVLNRAFPFYLVLLGGILAIRKKRLGSYLIISLPVLSVLLSLLLFAPVASMRYAVQMYYALPIVFIFAIKKW